MSDTRDAGEMRIPDAGLGRAQELDGEIADRLPAVLIWAAVFGVVVWALAIWKLLEILGISPR